MMKTGNAKKKGIRKKCLGKHYICSDRKIQNSIAVIGIEPHPSDKSNAYQKITLSAIL